MSARLFVVLLAGLVAVSACKTTEEKPPPADALSPGEEPPGRWHEVEPGDTLWSLSRRHGLTTDEVAEVNGIRVEDTLTPGQLLFLPGSGQPHTLAAEDVQREKADDHGAMPPSGTTTLTWPLEAGVLLRDYSSEGPVPYEGLMMVAPAGTAVLAAADGDVLHVGAEGAYGNMVLVRHAGDMVTIYAHVEEVQVRAGDHVRRGQAIASVGTSGRAESPQLHFQVRSGRTPLDPLTVLPPP